MLTASQYVSTLLARQVLDDTWQLDIHLQSGNDFLAFSDGIFLLWQIGLPSDDRALQPLERR